MLSITILCVGKLKERFYIDACAEYAKRLSGYCKLTVCELEELRSSGSSSDAQVKGGINIEGEKLLSKIPKGAYIIALCIEGERFKSQGLADRLNRLTASGNSRLCFLIGGSNGLSESVKNTAHMRLSMSDMTFPHHLARVMLLEQIYRAFKINQGGSYHK